MWWQKNIRAEKKMAKNLEETKSSPKKAAIFSLKLLFTLGALYIVFSKADLNQISAYVKSSDILYLFLAFVLLNVGQVISGLRMRFYFGSAGLTLKKGFAVSLYYVGMLFNLILPGGIGGDGYKAYYFKKHKKFPLKTSIRLIISGRANGLLLLCFFTLILAFFSPALKTIPYIVPLIIFGMVVLFPSYSLLDEKLLKNNIATQIGASGYSFFVQGSVLISAMFLLKAIGYEGGVIDYLVLFMISSIVSVIPISVGGVGLRELTFFYGASFLKLDPELGVSISVLYFVVNTLASLAGLVFFYQIGKK